MKGNTVQGRSLFHAEVAGPSHGGLSGLGQEVVRLLWFLAGSAMLLFTAFLAVLVIAGITFRVWPHGRHGRPRLVFAVSTALVVAVVAALAFPGSYRGVEAAFGSRAAGRPVADPVLPAASYPDLPTNPARYANGAATGAGLTGTTVHSLILYDGTDELYATLLSNLVSHFGAWTAHPVATYRTEELAGYDVVFYLGEPGGAALPRAFLDDVTQSRRQVVWIGGDIEQLTTGTRPLPGRRYGFQTQGVDADGFTGLEYKGSTLPMDQSSGAGYTRIAVNDPRSVTVLAAARRADGSTVPWAVRSGTLTYVTEDPLPSQSTLEGRNLVFSDLLFDALAPATRARHRALVRLEDVNPTTDPTQLRAIVDYLAGQQIPFSIGVFPIFRDPNGVAGNGDVTIRLSQRPALVETLTYAIAHGASLVLHGDTHQYGTKDNPNNGRSGDDAEFYLCHLDATQQLRLDGHVPEDSDAWALGRLDQALTELQAAGLPRPSTFEFPHYMASATDYLAVAKRFVNRYERALYFPGTLSGQPVDDSRPAWQMFPYTVRDVYGTTVVPEDLDYVHSDGGNIAGMLDQARNNLVVRDGVASFFYHPFLSVAQLQQVVDGIRALGYTFVSAQEVATSA